MYEYIDEETEITTPREQLVAEIEELEEQIPTIKQAKLILKALEWLKTDEGFIPKLTKEERDTLFECLDLCVNEWI